MRGSFGFELAELEGSSSSEGAPLRDAVDLATRAIIAAGKSDDALADAAEALDGRAFAALREFFTVLKKADASVRVVTDDLDREEPCGGYRQVRSAYARPTGRSRGRALKLQKS